MGGDKERRKRRARKVDCGQVGFPFYYNKKNITMGGSRKKQFEDILRLYMHGFVAIVDVVGRKINFSFQIEGKWKM